MVVILFLHSEVLSVGWILFILSLSFRNW
jgi:hypothetical protein